MRILAFTDIHSSEKALRTIRWKTRIFQPELLICAGDITIFSQHLDAMLKKINDLGKKTLIIHGNHEDEDDFGKKCKKYGNLVYLHKNHFLYKDFIFFGYGGGGFSLFDKGFNKVEKQFLKIIDKNKDKKIVFVTHAPPFNTSLDELDTDYHCGNKTIRNFSDKFKVSVHLCGHLHENFGKKQKINQTLYVNPGPNGRLLFL